jgi:tRNA-splicing endonuclease subunit Sen54
MKISTLLLPLAKYCLQNKVFFFLSFFISSLRNTKSKGICNEEMRKEELEVYEKNGKMWVATGIVRNGKIYTSIEETL